MSKIRLIGKNISFLAANRVVSVAISFFLFPFIVKYVGKEIYGVYLVAMTITGYFGLLDLGVMSALTKYVSEYNGKKDRESVNKIVNASLSFYVLTGITVALLLFFFSLSFVKFFKILPANIPVAKDLFLIASLSALLVWPLNTFRGFTQGLNLWNIDASVNISVQIINGICTYVLLISGCGIIQLFVVNQVLTILGSMFLYAYIRKNYCFKVVFPYLEFKTYKFIFNFSFFCFASAVISSFLFQVHNLLIGYFVSVSAVSTYAVAYNIQSYLRVINSTIGAPPWTIASEMEGRGEHESQRQLVLKGTKYMSAVFLPVILILFVFVEPFIIYWMGDSFRESILPAKVIILFWLFNGTLELAGSMLSAKGIVKKPLLIQLGVVAVNLAITLYFIKPLGILAPAIGLTFSMIMIGFPLTLRLSLKNLKIKAVDYFKKSISGNMLLYAFVYFISVGMLRYWYPKNIYAVLAEMAAIYSVSLSLYYACLSNSERLDIKRLFLKQAS
jgi:O-antigen/teichoic acid export membrane protein